MRKMLADHCAGDREADCFGVPNTHYFDLFAPGWIAFGAISAINPFLNGKHKTLKGTQRSMTHSDRRIVRKCNIA